MPGPIRLEDLSQYLENLNTTDAQGNLVPRTTNQLTSNTPTPTANIARCPYCSAGSNEQHGTYHNGLIWAPCPNALLF